ncbi:hypothetical protein SEPCBS57363_002482 [Sporothrix epigloea]|uniref:Viral a-type inclusion protein n=1 Tax=Sporothrix epigloea TaxID=1892477 RepID=A0ABP0DJE2_9PEZI
MDLDKRSAKSHELGLRYLDARHREDLVVKDDDIRRFRVQTTLLQGEKNRLEEHVSALNDRVGTLMSQYEEAQLQLESINRKCREQDGQLRAQTREHASLRTELLSFSSATADSTKVLTEKFALSREVALLKPEIEHLRTQLSHQKDVVSEKLALERQLNALELELANEKRTSQRAADAAAERQQSAKDRSATEIKLLQQVHDLENKLASEKQARKEDQKEMKEGCGAGADEIAKAVAEAKREGMRTKKALETELAEARGQLDGFELRVGDLKSKLREVREELKNVRAELEHASASGQDKFAGPTVVASKDGPHKSRTTTATKTKPTTKTKRRQEVEEPSGPELVLQTPGIGNEGRSRRPLKKKGFDASTAVQKSTFSITPFLSKTTNPLNDSTNTTAAGSTVADRPIVIDSVAETNILEDSSALLEDSILGQRVFANNALSSIDITESLSHGATSKAKTSDAISVKQRGRLPKEKILGDASMSKKNLKVQPATTESEAGAADDVSFRKLSVDKLADESVVDEQENRPVVTTKRAIAGRVKNPAVATVSTEAKLTTDVEPRKKKRKILGTGSKILLDGDDDDGVDNENDALTRPTKPIATAAAQAGGAATKRTVKALGASRTTAVGAGKRTLLGGVRNAFGEAAGGGFSPLKRDRRGVNASFLA